VWFVVGDSSVSFFIIIVIIIIIIIKSFMQDIYTYIPETNYVPREYSVAAILLLLFMVLISLVSVFNLLYFYISTFRSMCVVPNMAVFWSSLTSCFPGMLPTYFLNDFYYYYRILTSQLWLGNIHLSWDVVINRIMFGGLICSLKSLLQLNMCQELQIFEFIYIYIYVCVCVCVCIRVKLSLVRLCDSDFGITPFDDITIGITFAATEHIFNSPALGACFVCRLLF